MPHRDDVEVPLSQGETSHDHRVEEISTLSRDGCGSALLCRQQPQENAPVLKLPALPRVRATHRARAVSAALIKQREAGERVIGCVCA